MRGSIYDAKFVGEEGDIPCIPTIGTVAVIVGTAKKNNGVFIALESAEYYTWCKAIVFSTRECRDYFLEHHSPEMGNYKEAMMCGGHTFHIINNSDKSVDYADLGRTDA